MAPVSRCLFNPSCTLVWYKDRYSPVVSLKHDSHLLFQTIFKDSSQIKKKIWTYVLYLFIYLRNKFLWAEPGFKNHSICVLVLYVPPNCLPLPILTSLLQFSHYCLTIFFLQEAYLLLAFPVYLAGQIVTARSEHMCADLLVVISENGKRSFPQLRQQFGFLFNNLLSSWYL